MLTSPLDGKFAEPSQRMSKTLIVELQGLAFRLVFVMLLKAEKQLLLKRICGYCGRMEAQLTFALPYQMEVR